MRTEASSIASSIATASAAPLVEPRPRLPSQPSTASHTVDHQAASSLESTRAFQSQPNSKKIRTSGTAHHGETLRLFLGVSDLPVILYNAILMFTL
jgi:hypothetical protein